jgi:hypothetical protein
LMRASERDSDSEIRNGEVAFFFPFSAGVFRFRFVLGLEVSLSWPRAVKLAVLPCMLRPSGTYLDEAKPRQEMLPGSYERSPAQIS